MLKLAPPSASARYIAALQALDGLAYGLTTIAGGWLFDVLARRTVKIASLSISLDRFAILFVIGLIVRSLAPFAAARLEEPGAPTLKQLFKRRLRRDALSEEPLTVETG